MGRQAKVTRQQVLRAAREAFVDGGYGGTTLADIGARLGVSPAALFRHEPTKKALFAASMGAGSTEPPWPMPFQFLQDVPGDADPRVVLRRAAKTLLPFLQTRLRESIARWLYHKKIAGVGTLPLPFDPAMRPTPPQRNLSYLEAYLRRASRAGRIHVHDCRAAAVAFLATIHSYLFLQEVIGAFEKPLPFDRYLSTVLEIWEHGALGTTRSQR